MSYTSSTKSTDIMSYTFSSLLKWHKSLVEHLGYLQIAGQKENSSAYQQQIRDYETDIRHLLLVLQKQKDNYQLVDLINDILILDRFVVGLTSNLTNKGSTNSNITSMPNNLTTTISTKIDIPEAYIVNRMQLRAIVKSANQ